MVSPSRKKVCSWVVEVQQYVGSDDVFIGLPHELLKELKWKAGDRLVWDQTKDGTAWMVKKIKKK